MKKVTLFLITILLSVTSMSAQQSNSKIDWGPKYDHKGLYNIIGKSGNFIFVYHHGRSFMSTKPNLKIFKFNLKKELVKEYNLLDIIGKKNKLIDVNADEEKIVALVFNEEKKKAQFIEKLKIDPASMSVVQRDKVLRFKDKFEFIPFGYRKGYWSTSKRTLDYLKSDSGNKIAVIVKDEKKKFINSKILVLDRKEFYSEVNVLDLKLKDDKKSESLADIYIREDGALTVLKKHYFNSKRKDKKKNLPDYNFQLIRKPIAGVKSNLRIAVKNVFFRGSKIVDDAEGNTYFAALYERKYGKGAEGTVLYKISPENEVVFQTKHKSAAIKKGKERLDSDYEVTGFFRSGDRYIIMYRDKEFRIETTSHQQGGMTSTSSYALFRNKNSVIEAFDIQGTHHWTKIIYEDAVQRVLNHCIDYITYFSDEGIMIFTNMHKKNLEKLNHEKPKKKNFPNDDNVIVKINIDLEGEMIFDKLCEPGEIHIGKRSMKIIGDQIYFLSFQEKFDNLRLGTLPLGN